MSPEERQALQSLADAATPGPWGVVDTAGEIATVVPPGWVDPDEDDSAFFIEHGYIADEVKTADAALIAVARTAVPALLADIAEQERRIEKALAILDVRETSDMHRDLHKEYNPAIRRALTEEEKC